MGKKLAVIAIGGNSLIRDHAHQSVLDQYLAASETCGHIAKMIRDGWEVAIGHGNGPQIGFILRRSELAAKELHEIPLDACGADTQGALGYMLQQNLLNHLHKWGLKKSVATIVTQVEVDPSDPAFDAPSKPIGSFMSEARAKRRRARGWQVREDAGRGWRRVVPSPRPKRIIEEDVVKKLLDAGVVVITIGGGGIPVVAEEDGTLHGIPAVIDKDHAASMLATRLKADLLMITTSVEKVAINYRLADETWLDQMTLTEAKQYLAEGTHFAAGSMAPKIEATINFLENGGQEVIITTPDCLEDALAGKTGTHITP